MMFPFDLGQNIFFQCLSLPTVAYRTIRSYVLAFCLVKKSLALCNPECTGLVLNAYFLRIKLIVTFQTYDNSCICELAKACPARRI